MRFINHRLIAPSHRLTSKVAIAGMLMGAGIAGASAQTASTQVQVEAASDVLGEVTVTGTRIRGVAPVGSPIIQLDQDDLRRQGLTSVADALNNIPFVLKQGAGNDWTGGASESVTGIAFNKSPNLRGLGNQATLSLVNGHRVPYEGATMSAFDGDNIPAGVLKRVEIVGDGTSPVYGADAIAGTVNYIFRDPFDGIELSGQFGTANGQDSWQGTIVGGQEWGSGGVVLSYQHTDFDELRASSRSNLYNDDYSPFGGPASPAFSSPANVLVNGAAYAIPHGQDGTALTLAQLGPAGAPNRQNSWTGYFAIPGSDRDTGTINFKQRITDWLELFGDGFYSKRNYDMALVSQGPYVNLNIPNSNFYSPCNRSQVGAPAELVTACNSGSLSVAYSTVFDLPGGGPATRNGFSETWDGNLGAHFNLPHDWVVTLVASQGNHLEKANQTYFLGNGLPFSPALGGTTADTAFNVFCDGAEFACNPSSLTTGITGPNWFLQSEYKLHDYSLNIDGPVFTLPGGPVRVALGGEHYTGDFTNTNSFGSRPLDRTIDSAYAELYVPIFGEGNAVKGIKSLEIDIAGRMDDYSDVGRTTNPKVGINWSPTDHLKVHGSYGKSFRAPGLVDNDPFSQHGWLTPGPFPGSSVDAALCPTCAAIPGGLVFYQVIGGANGDLVPEKSKSYSLGIDWTPEGPEGLYASANYWWIEYTGQIGFAVYNAGPFGAINQQVFNPYIIYNPQYFPTLAPNNPVAFFGDFPTVDQSNPDCAAVFGQRVTTQALYDQMLACVNAFGDGGVFGPTSSSTNVVAMESGHRINAGSTEADGIDLDVHYTWSTSVGYWRAGAVAEYIFKWDQAVISGAPVVDVNNTFLYPLRFKGRGDVGWTRDTPAGIFSADVFINYSNAYDMDPNLLPGGVPDSFASIDSYTTFDLTLGYQTGTDRSPATRDLSVILSVQNLFDEDPPLVINSGSVGGIMFDNYNTSPLKRVVQLQIAKRF